MWVNSQHLLLGVQFNVWVGCQSGMSASMPFLCPKLGVEMVLDWEGIGRCGL